MGTKPKDAHEILSEFKKLGKAPAQLLLLSPDRVRRERALRHLLDSIGAQSIEVSRLDGKTLKRDHLERALGNLSLFSKVNVAVVDNADSIPASVSKEILERLPTLPEYSIFVGEKFPANSVFAKFFRSRGQAIELPALEGFELKRWAAKELKAQGIVSPPEEVVNLLVELSEGSPDEIARLVEHVALYADDGMISAEEIASLFRGVSATQEFDLLDAIVARNPMKSDFILRDLIRSEKNPFLILSLLSRSFSSYLAIKASLARGIPLPNIRQSMGVSPWIFQKYSQSAEKMSQPTLLRMQREILRADSLLKNRSLGPEIVLSELVASLATA